MNSRERFTATMDGMPVDRVPLLEEGIRDEVHAAWREQGMPADVAPGDLATYDRRERIELDLGPRPAFEGPIATRADLKEYRRRLDPDDPARLPAGWDQRVEAWRRREHILEIYVHSGFFLTQGANRWDSVEALLYRTHDDPELVRGVMEAYAECASAVLRRVLADVGVDFAAWSEPISGPDRPLLSPAMYRSLVLPTYMPIIETLKAGGVRTIVFQTYANSRRLLGSVVEAGFNCLWAVEATPGAMNYTDIRREFGPSLGLIGGIDLDALRQDEASIRRHMETLLPPLLAEGRYIPLADGRVRPDISYANYLTYRRLLEELALSTAAPV